MKPFKCCMVFAVALFVCTLAPAQEFRFRLALSARCAYTNAAGKIVSRNLSTRSFLKECAARSGVTNVNSLSLIYHVNGDSRGDLIEIVRNSDGSVVCPVFSLFYPTLTNLFDGSFVRVSNTNGTSAQRIFYVYGSQSSHSVGTALVNEKFPANTTARTGYSFQGRLQYFMLPSGTNVLAICNGKFSASQPFVPKNTP